MIEDGPTREPNISPILEETVERLCSEKRLGDGDGSRSKCGVLLMPVLVVI